MPRGGGHSSNAGSATLLHVFKKILKLDEDSDPIRALAQKGYMDMPCFLSIPINMFLSWLYRKSLNKHLMGKSRKLLCTRGSKETILL